MNERAMEKVLLIYSAICDIVQIYGESELGTCEVDTSAVATYCCSNKMIVDFFDCRTKDEIYTKFTDDILNGFAVWQFLKVSDWTKTMLMSNFEMEGKKQDEKDRKTYRCLSCEYYRENLTSIGIFCKCMRPQKDRWAKQALPRLKKSCQHYKNKGGDKI